MKRAALGLLLLIGCAASPVPPNASAARYKNPCPFGLGHIVEIETWEKVSPLITVPDSITRVKWACVAVQGPEGRKA